MSRYNHYQYKEGKLLTNQDEIPVDSLVFWKGTLLKVNRISNDKTIYLGEPNTGLPAGYTKITQLRSAKLIYRDSNGEEIDDDDSDDDTNDEGSDDDEYDYGTYANLKIHNLRKEIKCLKKENNDLKQRLKTVEEKLDE
jgi:hypothetical protein